MFITTHLTMLLCIIGVIYLALTINSEEETSAKKFTWMKASPLKATVNQLKALSPSIVSAAAKDVIKDEAEAFRQKLENAGITTMRYNGVVLDLV
ncbi:alpha/beta hydrolase fold [Mucilaginibacter pineti]|uniref:Alpha/beta hydrolase fold n=1 Tax=Mucilaginibacter pineti TaxID=1391627 RepID=A0A1G6X8K1_9SPHI|nr:alpha/beta hydrolase fold domain-containing protein [Mucilaginibacter pineti]SDD73636.1 alpha/beta hydrolase fold [Mucilaginibacter pineti]